MKKYETIRLSYTPKRKIVWQEICNFLNQRYISKDSRVLELGCGYGDFIGNINAREKVAIEISPFFKPYIESYEDITLHSGDVMKVLPQLSKNSFDVVFASNLFEHFDHSEIKKLLQLTTQVLVKGGKLIVIQPNFQLCAPYYFDDWTHKSVFSHISFADMLEANNFHIQKCLKKFLPFSFKTRLPISRLLVRMYINSPFKPRAGQFLIVAYT